MGRKLDHKIPLCGNEMRKSSSHRLYGPFSLNAQVQLTYECYTFIVHTFANVWHSYVQTLMRCFSCPLSPLVTSKFHGIFGAYFLGHGRKFCHKSLQRRGERRKSDGLMNIITFENCFSMWHLKYSKPYKSIITTTTIESA